MTKIAVIPARGGSKRIPRKNIKDFCGKPIIAYSIEAAIESNCFDRIIVSTDDEEIAEVALKFGAEVPFLRDAQLADDFTGAASVVKDAIIQVNDVDISKVCCIYATAPMVQANYIKKGLDLLSNDEEVRYAFSVTSYAFPIQRAITLNKFNHVSMIDSNKFFTRSQDLEECWHDAGQFYWGSANAWKDELAIFETHSIGVKVPRYLVQDIDTLEDWETAELLYRTWSKR